MTQQLLVRHKENPADATMQSDMCKPCLLASGQHKCTLTSLVVKFFPITVIPAKAGWVLYCSSRPVSKTAT